jgi:Na+/H+ antiporter NhaC
MFNNITPGWYSLLPPLVALIFSFTTRQVILALFSGIVTGGVVLFFQTGNLLQASIVENFLLPALGSRTFAIILLVYLWSLGGIIGMWEKTGGAHHFAQVLGTKFARGPRASLLFTWLVGLIFHQGGTVSTVLAGTTVKPVTDQHRVSHEELAYVVDSTASPVATLIPLNAWPLYVGGLVVGTIPLIPDNITAYTFYLSAIRYNFYALFTLLFTLLFSLGLLPWVGKKMYRARHRARTTGNLDGPDAAPLLTPSNPQTTQVANYPPSIWDFIVPIGLLLGMTVIPFILWKWDMIRAENANWINAAFLSAAVSSMLLAFIRGMPLSEILDGFSRGCKSMTLGAIIIGLAVALGIVTNRVGTADYLMLMTQDMLSPIALPGLLTLLCMIVAFATGTSLGTYAVVFPIALPLAYSLNADPQFVLVCFGAVMGGTVFGDQCSPISDTTILSSMFTGCDLMDHVRTQLPLALMTALLGTICSTLVVYFL